MKKALRWIGITLASLALGLGSALWMVFSVPEHLTANNGPWRTSLAAGSEDAGIYLRATVALIGLLALNKSEAVYFIARTDDDGRPLTSACNYRVEGSKLDARWWSVTLYGAYTYFIPNEERRYSYNDANVARDLDGRFAIAISRSPQAGNWLSSGDEDRLHLALRLYNPGPSVYSRPAEIALPRIVRGDCR